MLKNWTNIFIYHIKNNKLFTALNVLGLSIGIAALIFAILYWNDEHSYDQWNPEKDKIYSVMSNLGGGNIWAVSSAIPAPILKSTTSYLDEYCYFRTNYSKQTIQYHGKIELVDKILTAQSSFFSFFPFEFIRGNAKSAIHDRNSIALSEETASRLFKDENPMGKQVRYAEQIFVVRGVYRLNEKSSVMPSAVTTVIEDDLEKNRESWGLNYGLMLKLKKASDTTAVIKKLDQIFLDENYKKQAKAEGLDLESFIKRYGEPIKAQLLPLTSARLYNGNTAFAEGNAKA